MMGVEIEALDLMGHVLEGYFEVLFDLVPHRREHLAIVPLLVLLVEDPIIKDPVELMDDQPDYLRVAGQLLRLDDLDALEDPVEVPDIEQVVGLVGGGLHGLEDVDVDVDDQLGRAVQDTEHVRVLVVVGLDVPVHVLLVYPIEGVLVGVDGVVHVEVAQQSRADQVPASPCWAHCRHYLGVDDLDHPPLLVVPAFVVHELPQQLNGRLGPVRIVRRHVQVVYKEQALLAEPWPIDAFPSLLEPQVDDVLGLKSRRGR